MYDNGDIAALESKLEEFFRTQQEQEASTEKALPYRPIQNYIPTSISEDVCKLIRYCQIEKGMVIIHGDAGIGKTKGAEKFVRENPAASVYIQATPSIGTLGNLLKVVARALKVPESRNKLDLMLSIWEKLEGTNKVIIIDEAQHLQLRALEEIRAWADPSPTAPLLAIHPRSVCTCPASLTLARSAYTPAVPAIPHIALPSGRPCGTSGQVPCSSALFACRFGCPSSFLLSFPDSLSGPLCVLLGVYLFSLLPANNLHFSLGVFYIFSLALTPAKKGAALPRTGPGKGKGLSERNRWNCSGTNCLCG